MLYYTALQTWKDFIFLIPGHGKARYDFVDEFGGFTRFIFHTEMNEKMLKMFMTFFCRIFL